jgi:hypothetical protein
MTVHFTFKDLFKQKTVHQRVDFSIILSLLLQDIFRISLDRISTIHRNKFVGSSLQLKFYAGGLNRIEVMQNLLSQCVILKVK